MLAGTKPNYFQSINNNTANSISNPYKLFGILQPIQWEKSVEIHHISVLN